MYVIFLFKTKNKYLVLRDRGSLTTYQVATRTINREASAKLLDTRQPDRTTRAWIGDAAIVRRIQATRFDR